MGYSSRGRERVRHDSVTKHQQQQQEIALGTTSSEPALESCGPLTRQLMRRTRDPESSLHSTEPWGVQGVEGKGGEAEQIPTSLPIQPEHLHFDTFLTFKDF